MMWPHDSNRDTDPCSLLLWLPALGGCLVTLFAAGSRLGDPQGEEFRAGAFHGTRTCPPWALLGDEGMG